MLRCNHPNIDVRLALLLIAGLMFASTSALSQKTPVAPTEKSAASQQSSISPTEKSVLQTLENAFAGIADQVEPSVVAITSKKIVEEKRESDGFDFFFGWPFGPDPQFPRRDRGEQPNELPEIAGGSGIIIRSEGYVLTNAHVVENADIVTVKLKDGREFKSAKVLKDEEGDLALIKIDANGLPAVKLGDSDKIRVGQWAIAIGAPFGLSQSLTVGVISALGRQFSVPEGFAGKKRDYPEMIQTDAAINFGNSGGPLVNINGEVIGLNTAIRSPSGGNVGIGFAIPINSAKWIVEKLISDGKVTRGYLGVDIRDITPALANLLGVKEGAVVLAVGTNSAADKAGIQVKDVIVKFGLKPVTGELQLRRLVAMTAPGSKVQVVVMRDKKQQTLTATLGDRGKDMAENPEVVKTKIGIEVEELTKEKAESLSLGPDAKGVLVSSIDRSSPAAMVGIRPKDVITEVNNQKTPTVAIFDDAVSKLKSGDLVMLIVRRGNRTSMVSFSID